MNPSGVVKLIKASSLWSSMKTAVFLVLACMILSSAAPARAAEVGASHGTRFWVNGTWVPAEDLKVGDVFVTPDGKLAIARDVEAVSMENATCYGLVTDSTRQGQANTHVSAVEHANWIARWWQRVYAIFG